MARRERLIFRGQQANDSYAPGMTLLVFAAKLLLALLSGTLILLLL